MYKKRNKGIVSLLAIMGVGFFAMTSALTIASGVLGELVKNRSIISGGQSFYTAESAMKEGVAQYIWFGNEVSEEFPAIVALNQVSASITSVTCDWPYCKSHGQAHDELTYRGASLGMMVFPEGLAFDHAIYANHSLDIDGNAQVNGSVFANDEINFQDNASEVNGNAYSASDTINEFNDDSVTGETFTEVDPVPPPEIISSVYYDVALNNPNGDGSTTTTSALVTDYLKNNNTIGVVYVEDPSADSQVSGNNTVLTGTLFVEGNLNITGGTYSATSTYDPATYENFPAVVVEGDLNISGNVTINGIVYVKGATTFGNGTITINGSLISAGGVETTTVSGNVTINYVPANWQDLEGLNTVTAADPVISDWTEE